MPPSTSVTAADEIVELDEIDGQGSHDSPATGTETHLEIDPHAWRDASDVGTDEARAAWAVSARDVLIGVAKNYHHTITSKELAHLVQEHTRIRATQATHYWITDVLSRVTVDSERRDEPLLSALCVNVQGSVGDGYAGAVETARGERPEDGDDHAARERLACHTFFDAPNLPDNGGVAVLTRKLADSRSRARRARIAETPEPICPKCTMRIPPTGICDNCD
jgi:hypothetical protein